MIKSFKHKGLENFFLNGTKKGIQPQQSQKLADLLDLLDSAKVIHDMRFPVSDLHALKGSLKGLWAIKVSGNWRLTFQFHSGDAHIVDYRDYH